MPSELSRSEGKDEGNLLIEAVSLLVQRQRETESWVAEQIWQAEERAAASEQRYAELEARLAEIEAQLSRLVHDVEPPRDAAVGERLLRLREQLDSLRAEGNGSPHRRSPTAVLPPAAPTLEGRVRESTPLAPAAAPRHESRQSGGAPAVASAGGQNVGLMDLLGSSPEDRAGVLLMGAGVVAVLYAAYAVLSQLRIL